MLELKIHNKMEIKFKQNNEKSISIIGIQNGVEKEVGCIFTPSSSSQNTLNAIQVCGFEEAFDLWGCGRYVLQPNGVEAKLRMLEKGNIKWMRAKDIQLLFNFNTKADGGASFNEIECLRCFNSNVYCTCENKEGKNKNPFNLKREHQLKEILEFEDKNIARASL